MTTILLIQIASLFIFIVFISVVNLQSRAKAILTTIFIVLTVAIYLMEDSGKLKPYLESLVAQVAIVGLVPLLAVAAAYSMLVRYTLPRNRTTRRK